MKTENLLWVGHIDSAYSVYVQQCPIENWLEGCFEKPSCSLEALRIYGNGFIVCEVFRHFFVGQKHESLLSIVRNKTKAMSFFTSSDFVQLSSQPTFQSNSFRPIWLGNFQLTFSKFSSTSIWFERMNCKSVRKSN